MTSVRPACCPSTDRAVILDEILDYVKFLRLQVKVLSMSRLGGAGAIAQLVSDVPLSSIEGEGMEGGSNQESWENWSNDGTEEVANLMEVDIEAGNAVPSFKSTLHRAHIARHCNLPNTSS